MTYFLMALIATGIGFIPIYLLREPLTTFIYGLVVVLILWPIFYFQCPSGVWMFGGYVGCVAFALLVINTVVEHVIRSARDDTRFKLGWSACFPALACVAFSYGGCASCQCTNASKFAGLIGTVEERDWSKDLQPADPKHVITVPPSLAKWLADKQLGSAPGAIGSQFEISEEHLTLQLIHGELWYVGPLDFREYTTWSSSGVSPGYVMVFAEDPQRQVVVKIDEKLAFMPGAFFGHNLERHLQTHGYWTSGLAEATFEIDEAGKAWWVVTVFKPTMGYAGWKVQGAVLVDPVNGATTYYALGQVPTWVDRVIPQSFVKDYLTFRGGLGGGWWNSVWAKSNLTKPEDPTIVYGSDGEPYWVTPISSDNDNDKSIVSLAYTNARTGVTHSYRATGGTNSAILAAVNNVVSFRKFHGEHPSIYNVYGTLAAVVPVLGENNTFQGVAIARLDMNEVVFGTDMASAASEYRKKIGKTDATLPGQESATIVREGLVDRFSFEVRGGETTYYLHLADERKLFTGSSGISQKFALTKEGDRVKVSFLDAKEEVVPLLSFESLTLIPKPASSASK